MKMFLLLIALVGAGALFYPSWHEHTASACEALNKRAGEIANQEMRALPYATAQSAPQGLLRDSSGGVVAATLDTVLPGAPAAVGCAVGYWRLVASPDLNRLMASAH